MRLAGFALTGLLLALPAAADEVMLSTPTGALHGAWLPAARNAPAILIIAGSGPTDRDGNAATLGLHTDMYKKLADGLAAQGIASLRFDKRGIGESRGALSAEKDVTLDSFADDAALWAAELRRMSGAKCVWLLGHSEGALLAEIVASQDGICGLVLVSGMGRPLGVVMREQLRANPAYPPALLQTADGIFTQLEAGHTVEQVPPVLAVLFRPSVQPFLISALTRDPVAALAKTRAPVLILQGDTDIQVSVADARLLAAARPDAKLVVLPGVNHILKTAPAGRAGNLATYADPSLPLAPGLVDTIAQFVKAHP